MKVLFLCTANSCRSILSEAIFNHLAPSGMQAYSAGSQPSGVVNPLSLQALEVAGIDTQGLASKANEAHRDLAPDLVISVCGNAAKHECPAFFGQALRVHWGLDDPSEVKGDAAQIAAAFASTVAHIQRRLQAFINLPFAQLTPEQLHLELKQIGDLA
jgi:arsenate reductase